MELPMVQEQQPQAAQAMPPQVDQGMPPQAAQGLPPAPGGAPAQGKQPFPANKAEALQFSNDILQVLYDEKTNGNIVQQLDDISAVNVGQGLGIVAGNIIGNRVADVRAQTGRPLEMKLVVDGVKAVVKELGEMGAEFFEFTPEVEQTAVRGAVQMIDKLKENAGRPQQ